MPGAALTLRSEPARVREVAHLGNSPAVAETLAFFSAQRKWINAQHLQLVRVPASTFQEQKRAEWMVQQFRALGCESRADRAGNVITYPQGSTDGPLVALTAHLDTVLEPRTPEDVKAGPDGQIHGPGASDNGAGLAALLAIAYAIRSNSAILASPLPLVLIANVGEEGEGNLSGMRYVCRQSGLGSRIASFLVLDGPSTDHITSRALASRRFEIAVTGPGGHSWSDYGVPNPVHMLSRVISTYADNGPASGGPAGARASFNFGLIEGGTSINSIPSSARAKLDLRSESPERLEHLSTLLMACVEQALETENERAAAGRLAAKVREIGSRPGGRLADDALILRHIRAVDSHLGIRSHLDCASTDANIPLSLGLPAISIGAGGQGGGAHTLNEWYHPEGREVGLRRIFLTLCLLMRDIDPLAAQ